MFGGGRALLMQLAHPLVAAGVADHSDFLVNPIARLERTMELSLGLVFGTIAEARECARAVNRAHERVSGVLREDVPGFPAGTPYRAGEPDLLLWVHATLVDSALQSYEMFVGRLSEADREAYWRESWTVGRLLGIPPPKFPRTYAEFSAYVDEMIASRLAVSAGARRLAAAVLRPPVGRAPAPVFWPHEVLTIGLLPERLREQYGFRWTPARSASYRALVASIRGMVAVAPPFLRTIIPARAALKRWQGAA